MPKSRTIFCCRECGAEAPRWAGRCPGCGEWNSMEEAAPAPLPRSGVRVAAAREIGEVGADELPPRPSGVREFDRVLAGGVVPGSVTLIGGEPGIGKSTLLLQAVAGWARKGSTCLVVTAEESLAQVRSRAQRLGGVVPGVWLLAETELPAVRSAVLQTRPDILVVDSIQTVWDPEIDSPPGSVAQVRGCAHELVSTAKAGGPATVLVGHVTKEGALAGPRVLEHLVDTVMSFEGDRHHALRMLRTVKHRFGPTGELGLFEMGPEGLAPVVDPGGLFLDDRRPNSPGSVVFPAMDGRRPLLVEVQALVTEAGPGGPRRSASGFETSRLTLLLAVLQSRVGLALGQHDVFVSVAGGVKINDPGADLAICLAVASAFSFCPIDPGTVVLGEVGLGGEIRQVAQSPRRLAESRRLGFFRALCPPKGPDDPVMEIIRVSDLSEAVVAHLGGAPMAQ